MERRKGRNERKRSKEISTTKEKEKRRRNQKISLRLTPSYCVSSCPLLLFYLSVALPYFPFFDHSRTFTRHFNDCILAAMAFEGDNDNEGLLAAFEVVLGAYEHVLYGVGCRVAALAPASPSSSSASSKLQVQLHRAFVTEPHGGAVTAVAAAGPTVVSGSADELIKYARWAIPYRKRKKISQGGDTERERVQYEYTLFMETASVDAATVLSV